MVINLEGIVKYLLTVVVLLMSINIYLQWKKVNNNYLNWETGLAIDAKDSLSVIFSAGSNVYSTRDGGENWQSFSLPYNSSAIDITMINSNTIVLVCDDGSILRTSDNGENWTEVWYNPELSTFMNYVECFEDSIVIAMGDGNTNSTNSIDKPLILFSDNEGISWKQIPITEQIGAYSGDTWRRLDFITPSFGYFRSSALMVENQGLYNTNNGGSFWKKVESGAGFALIKFYNENIGLAADINKVYLTKDGGSFWETSEYEFNSWPNDFEFLPGDSNKVWYANLESLFYSGDMGMNWDEVKLQENKLRARDIVFADNKNGWLLCDHGNIFYTNNNGGITVHIDQDLQREVVNNYCLEQNFPNPFNPTTTINYQIPKDGNVSLKIYDVLGKEITILVNEEKRAGSYKVSFDTKRKENLSSGIYFARLESGKFVKTIKLLLMK